MRYGWVAPLNKVQGSTLKTRRFPASVLLLGASAFGLLATPAAGQNQVLDTSNGQACTVAGGVLTGSNLFTDLDNGTFGTGSGAANEIPTNNPYPSITGGIYQNSYSTFPHGSYTIISNQVTRRNNSQSNGTQIDPVFGTNGRFFVSDPNTTSPTFSSQLTDLVLGESYEISFWVADSERRDGADKQRMAITLDGNTASPLFTTPFINSGGGDSATTPVVWYKWSFVYTHSSAATTADLGVAAVETGASGRDIFFDNISFQACSFDTDLQTVKTLASSDTTVSEGDTVTFEIEVTNNGSNPAQATILTDLLPSGLTATLNNGSVTAGSYDSVSGLWTIGSLAAGASVVLTLEGKVDAGLVDGATIQNVTTTATHAANDPTTAGDDLTASVTVEVIPEIVPANDSATSTSGIAGENDVLNVLDGDFFDGSAVNIADVDLSVASGSSVPDELTFDPATGEVSVNQATPNGTYSFDYQICEAGTTTNCETATATITVALPSGTAFSPELPDDFCTWTWSSWLIPGGYVVNEPANYNPSRFIFDTVGSSAGANTWYGTTIAPNVANVVLDNNVSPTESLSAADSERFYGVGYFADEPNSTVEIEFEDTGRNDGHVFAVFDTSGNLIARFPTVAQVGAGRFYFAGPPRANPFEPEGINVGTSWTRTFSFDVPSDGRYYIHYIGADENNRITFATNNACRTTDLTTVKTLASASATPAIGETVTFEIEVTNNGPISATAVTLTDLIPAGLTPTSDNGNVTQGSYDDGTGTWAIGTLADGASATLTIEGTVDPANAGTEIENITTAAEGDQYDPDTSGDDLEELTTVASDPDLEMIKEADDDAFVTVGQRVTYTYTITNTGNEVIRNVAVGDAHNAAGPAPTPADETLLTDNRTQGDSTDAVADDGVWDVLAPGDVITFTGTYVVQQADIDNLQ